MGTGSRRGDTTRGRRGRGDSTVGEDQTCFPEAFCGQPMYNVEARRYEYHGAGGRTSGGGSMPPASLLKSTSPEALTQYVINSVMPFSSTPRLSREGIAAITERLGFLAGAAGRLNTPFEKDGMQFRNAREGVATLLQYTYPDHAPHALGSFARGGQTGTAMRNNLGAAEAFQRITNPTNDQIVKMAHQFGVGAAQYGATTALPAGSIPREARALGLRTPNDLAQGLVMQRIQAGQMTPQQAGLFMAAYEAGVKGGRQPTAASLLSTVGENPDLKKHITHPTLRGYITASEQIAPALKELKPGLSHADLATVAHRIGAAARGLPEKGNTKIPLPIIEASLADHPMQRDIVNYLRASGTNTPAGLVSLTAQTGYLGDPVSQAIAREALKAGLEGKPVPGAQRLAQIATTTPTGERSTDPVTKAKATMQRLGFDIFNHADTLSPDQLAAQVYAFGRAASTPIATSGRAHLPAMGTQQIPDEMLPIVLKENLVTAFSAMALADKKKKDPSATALDANEIREVEAGVGMFLPVMLSQVRKPATSASLFQQFVIEQKFGEDNPRRAIALRALEEGLQGKRRTVVREAVPPRASLDEPRRSPAGLTDVPPELRGAVIQALADSPALDNVTLVQANLEDIRRQADLPSTTVREAELMA